jgi:hypothetical protein
MKVAMATIPHTVHSALQQLKAFSMLISVLFWGTAFVRHLADFVEEFGAIMGNFENTFSKVETVKGMLGRFFMKFHLLTRDYFYRRLGTPWNEQTAMPTYFKIV